MAIHQEVTFTCDISKIYSALSTSQQFSELSGAPADIGTEEGSAFSCFGGQITGRTLELKADEMIVQAWRASAWPQGVYSVVRFTLSSDGDDTLVTLDQSGFPEDMTEHLNGGWHKMYWEPLKAYCS